MRRVFLAAMLLWLAACAEIGRPWPDLTERQIAERDAWARTVRSHAAHALREGGMPVRETQGPTCGPEARFELQLTVDRTGRVVLVRILNASPWPEADARVFARLTAAGPLPPPPASLVAFGEHLSATFTLCYRRSGSRRVQRA